MKGLKDRLSSHAAKVDKQEELEAALAGVFNKEAQAVSEEFTRLVADFVKPAFTEFKATLRELGRDAEILCSLPNAPIQSIALILRDRYLTFGVGKTLKLVNPKDDISKVPNAKFYELSRMNGAISIRLRVDGEIGTVSTQVGYEDVTPAFLENELAAFFERAYPTPL